MQLKKSYRQIVSTISLRTISITYIMLCRLHLCSEVGKLNSYTDKRSGVVGKEELKNSKGRNEPKASKISNGNDKPCKSHTIEDLPYRSLLQLHQSLKDGRSSSLFLNRF